VHRFFLQIPVGKIETGGIIADIPGAQNICHIMSPFLQPWHWHKVGELIGIKP
jgi:hypothetical protein